MLPDHLKQMIGESGHLLYSGKMKLTNDNKHKETYTRRGHSSNYLIRQPESKKAMAKSKDLDSSNTITVEGTHSLIPNSQFKNLLDKVKVNEAKQTIK